MIHTAEIDSFPSLSLQRRDAEIVAGVMNLHDGLEDPSNASQEIHQWLEATTDTPERRLTISGQNADYALTLLSAVATGQVVNRSHETVNVSRRQRHAAISTLERTGEVLDNSDVAPSLADGAIVDGIARAVLYLQTSRLQRPQPAHSRVRHPRTV